MRNTRKQYVGKVRMERLAVNIRVFRRRLGITQAELAEQIGVAQQRVALFETSKAIPDAFQLQDIASVLAVSIDILLVDE